MPEHSEQAFDTERFEPELTADHGNFRECEADLYRDGNIHSQPGAYFVNVTDEHDNMVSHLVVPGAGEDGETEVVFTYVDPAGIDLETQREMAENGAFDATRASGPG